MRYYTLYELVFPLCFLIVAAWLLLTGFRGLLSKRPTACPGRLGFAFTTLFLLPFLLLSWNIVLFGPRNGKPDINEFAIVAIPLVLIFCWKWMKGYSVVGLPPEKVSELLNAAETNLEVRRNRLKWLGSIGFSTAICTDNNSATTSELRKLLRTETEAVEYRAFLLQVVLGTVLTVAAFAIHFLA